MNKIETSCLFAVREITQKVPFLGTSSLDGTLIVLLIFSCWSEKDRRWYDFGFAAFIGQNKVFLDRVLQVLNFIHFVITVRWNSIVTQLLFLLPCAGLEDSHPKEMRAIFCGNFEYDARQSELGRLFRRYGKVDKVDMKSGKIPPPFALF